MNKTENTDKNENWFKRNHELLIGNLVTIVVFTTAFIKELNIEHAEKISELVTHGLLSISIGAIVTAILSIKTIRKDNNKSNQDIIELINREIVEKTFRKLVSTNAIILNHNEKLALTARIINDFPNLDDIIKQEPKFESSLESESIDLVRMLSYQNLILTPKYLDYFFYRKTSVKKAQRIVVLDKDQLNGKICQATLTYLYLSVRYGYVTYIISELRYKQFLDKYCNINGKSKTEKDKQVETLKMIKGNPFIFKLPDHLENFSGEYTNFRAGNDSYGEKIAFKNKNDYWILLENLIKNSIEINSKSTGFEEDIRVKIVNLDKTAII
ncbi:MAG: hypothetical protein VB102_05540 [Paludibacter sp.]|nr:hypothetical protein [Paludibacter sp.]